MVRGAEVHCRGPRRSLKGVVFPRVQVMTPRSQTGPVERAAIHFESVSKRFVRADGSELLAIENVGFALPAGRIVALLGPSGSGKTTLLNMAAGLIPPDAGEIRIAGRNPAETDWKRV